MKRYDIAGLGSCCWDYVAQVDYFASNDSKVTAKSLQEFPGGVTANGILQGAMLGLKTAWCGALGKDKNGDKLLELFKKDKIDAYPLFTRATQSAWIAVDSKGERQIYVFLNGNMELTPEVVNTEFAPVLSNCRHFHTEIANIPLAVAIAGAEIAKRHGANVFLDVDADINHLIETGIGTQEEMDKLLRLADVIKLSESSAKSLAKTLSGSEDVASVLPFLLKYANIVAITLGDKGSIIADKSQTLIVPAILVKCTDSTGAGDAFMGGLSYAILKKMPLKEMGMFANACGANCCTKIGARSFGAISDISRLR